MPYLIDPIIRERTSKFNNKYLLQEKVKDLKKRQMGMSKLNVLLIIGAGATAFAGIILIRSIFSIFVKNATSFG